MAGNLKVFSYYFGVTRPVKTDNNYSFFKNNVKGSKNNKKWPNTGHFTIVYF